MAGRGPAPKPADQRARHDAPGRGDWVSLPPLKRAVLPALPKRERGEGPWSSRTKRMWSAWRADWVTGAYGPADIAMAVELAYLYEHAVTSSAITAWGEVRQWMDRLGLTMKGKRDLRLCLAGAEPRVRVSPPFGGLRLVDDSPEATT